MAKSSETKLAALIRCGCAVTRLQFADASKWEECLIIRKGAAPAAFADWREKTRPAKIGCEAFFDAPEIGAADAFAGLRLSAAEAVAACSEMSASLARGENITLRDFVSRAEKASGAALFQNSPEYLELGAVNRWNSFGPLRFWNAGSVPPSRAFAAAFADAKKYHGTLPVPAAIEFAWTTPTPHWLGLPITEKTPSGFIISKTKAEKILELM